ncbi:MAG: S41 family peptidase [Oscillospiraceae bacterium]|nr:S41 family peptidase [Oscillospiraceae bacterium]
MYVTITALITFILTTGLFTGFRFTMGEASFFRPPAVSERSIEKFAIAKGLILSRFLDPVSEERLLEGALLGMTWSMGDRYTSYYPADLWQPMLEGMEGRYTGIGVSVLMTEEGIAVAADPDEGTPAHEAGILAGDVFVSVDGLDASAMGVDELVAVIRGHGGDRIEVVLYRGDLGRNIRLDVGIRKIRTVNLYHDVLGEGIGYVRIVRFDASTAEFFAEAVGRLKAEGIRALIVDVRGNSGGYFDQVVKVCDYLLPEGVIVFTEGRDGERAYSMSEGEGLGLPLAVLIDGDSASASEILAGAVKDNRAGVLIGRRTFGKGLVQASYTFKDGSGMRYTIERYYTPSGACIDGEGIEPDVDVECHPDYRGVPVERIPESDDAQLRRAIDFFGGLVGVDGYRPGESSLYEKAFAHDGAGYERM